jgi:hypothetical protein
VISFKKWLNEKGKKRGEKDKVPSAPTIGSAQGANGDQSGVRPTGDDTPAGGGND